MRAFTQNCVHVQVVASLLFQGKVTLFTFVYCPIGAFFCRSEIDILFSCPLDTILAVVMNICIRDIGPGHRRIPDRTIGIQFSRRKSLRENKF